MTHHEQGVQALLLVNDNVDDHDVLSAYNLPDSEKMHQRLDKSELAVSHVHVGSWCM